MARNIYRSPASSNQIGCRYRLLDCTKTITGIYQLQVCTPGYDDFGLIWYTNQHFGRSSTRLSKFRNLCTG